MAEKKFHVIARLDDGPDVYYRGAGNGLFNANKHWVGALMWDCAKKMTLVEAEQVVADNATLLPNRRLEIVPV